MAAELISATDNANIVRLPTAAPRQVRQRSCVAVRNYISENPWPGEYKPWWVREREREEAARPSLAHIERTPALIIAMSTYGMANEDDRKGMFAVAKLIDAIQPSDASRDALLMMEAVLNLKQTAQDVAAAASDQPA